MSRPDPIDPLIEIILSAYRRGLSILEKSQPATGGSADPLNATIAPTHKGDCHGGANGDSRNAPASEDQTNASTSKI